MNTDDIASRCKIAVLSLSSWRATRLHKPETADVNSRHGTEAARVSVRVCNHPLLSAITKLHNEVRAEHAQATRPTIQDGMRLIPLARELEHSGMIGKRIAEHEALVSQFAAIYDDERAQAPARLNGLYDASFWPENVSEKFSFSCKYLSCPVDGAWSDWLQESAAAATMELREQLLSAVRRVAERCGQDGRLHATVFANLKDLLADIPDMNIGDDPVIRQLAQAAQTLANVDAEIVRERPAKRAQLAQEANRIAGMFSGLGTAGMIAEMAVPAGLESVAA